MFAFLRYFKLCYYLAGHVTWSNWTQRRGDKKCLLAGCLIFFGFVVLNIVLEDHNQVTLLTVEELLGQRWFLMYQEKEGTWGVCSRYALFETFLAAPDMPQGNALIVDVRVSLDDIRRFVVIGQDDNHHWVINYLEEEGRFFPERVLTMLNDVAEDRVVSEEMTSDEQLAYMKLEKLEPHIEKFLGSTMVET